MDSCPTVASCQDEGLLTAAVCVGDPPALVCANSCKAQVKNFQVSCFLEKQQFTGATLKTICPGSAGGRNSTLSMLSEVCLCRLPPPRPHPHRLCAKWPIAYRHLVFQPSVIPTQRHGPTTVCHCRSARQCGQLIVHTMVTSVSTRFFDVVVKSF